MRRVCFFSLLLVSMIVSGVSAQTTAIPVPLPDNGDICWDKDQMNEVESELSREGFDEFIAEINKGSGFFSALFHDSEYIDLIGGYTYRVPEGESSSFTYTVYSPEDPRTVRFWAYHNAQQMTLGEDNAPYMDVEITDEEKFDLTLELPPLDDGIHDFVLMYNDEIDDRPNGVGNAIAYDHRFTLIVGDPQIPTENLTYEMLPADGSLAADDPLQFGFTLGDDLEQWSYPDETHVLATEEPLSFDILTGFFGGYTQETVDFPPPTVGRAALTLLMDYEQIPFTDDGAEVLYGEVSSDTAYTRLPVTLPAFEEPGYHELAMVQINNPRVPMCILNGGQAYSLNSDVNFIRVGIDVVAD